MNRLPMLMCVCALLGWSLEVSAATSTTDGPVAPPVTEDAVTVRLMPDITHWIAGRQHLVGVHFEMEPGWHLYWRGQNDSGLPIQVTQVSDPDASEADALVTGPVRWPPPERLVHPGDLVDHVYHDAVTLLLPVTVPASAQAGSPLTLRVEADWLVCEEACLPGSAEVSLTMTVAAPGTVPERSDDADTLGSVLARIPTRLSEDVVIEWPDDERSTLQISSPLATRMAFYPAEDGLALVDVAQTCAALGPRLILHPDPDPPYRPEQAGPPALRGILEVWFRDDQPSRLSLVDLPGPQHDNQPTPSAPPGDDP